MNASRVSPILTSLIPILMVAVSFSCAAEPPLTALAIVPGDQQFLLGSQQGITLHGLENQQRLRTIETQLEHVHDLKFSPDGKYLLAVGGTPGNSGQAELFTWPDARLHTRIRVADDLLYRAVWASNSNHFAVGGQEPQCVVLTIEGQEVAVYRGHSRPVLTLTILTDPQPNQNSTNAGLHPLVSAGVDQTIQIWSPSGSRLRTLNNHTGSVTDLALKAVDGTPILMASSSEDRTVRLWQPASGRMVKFLRLESVPRRIAWHTGGTLIAACDDGTICQIDPASMQLLNTQVTPIQPINELELTETHMLVAGEGGLFKHPIW